jgi:uncharacterized membrane protein
VACGRPVFITPKAGTAQALVEHLRGQDILVDAGATLQLVTHLDLSRADIVTTARAVKQYYA